MGYSASMQAPTAQAQGRRRGVCYDVGRVLYGNWRKDYSPGLIRRELKIIATDLHCNAVRICGQDADRLVVAAEAALGLGMEVWLSPELWNERPKKPSTISSRLPPLPRGCARPGLDR